MSKPMKPKNNGLSYEPMGIPKEPVPQKRADENRPAEPHQSKNDTLNPKFTVEITNSTDTEDQLPQKHTEELSGCIDELRHTDELSDYTGQLQGLIDEIHTRIDKVTRRSSDPNERFKTNRKVDQ